MSENTIETGLTLEISQCETLEQIDKLKTVVYQVRDQNLVNLWRKKYWSLAQRSVDIMAP